MPVHVPEKPSRMDNGVQLFSTCSVIALPGLSWRQFHHGLSKDVHRIIHAYTCQDTLTGGRRPSGLWVCTYVCGSLCMGEKSHASTQVLSTLLAILLARAGAPPATSLPGPNELPFPATLFFGHCTPCTFHEERGKAPPDSSIPRSSRHFHLVCWTSKEFHAGKTSKWLRD